MKGEEVKHPLRTSVVEGIATEILGLTYRPRLSPFTQSFILFAYLRHVGFVHDISNHLIWFLFCFLRYTWVLIVFARSSSATTTLRDEKDQ